jgi:transposase InsO family protein
LPSSSRKKYYQFTAIDDCTSIRVLRIYDKLNQKTAIQFAGYLLDKLPFRVEAIQADNGSEFQTAFHWHLADRGIRHIYIKPATPRLNGKVERSHRIDAEEFYRQLKGVLIDDTAPIQRAPPGMAGLLQLPSPAWQPRRPDPLRTPPPENHRRNDPRVNDLRQSSCFGPVLGPVRLRLMCDTVASLDARHSRNASGAERD